MARKLPARVKRHQGEADPSQIHLKGEQDCLQLSWRKDGRGISKFTRGRYDTISVSASSEATEQLSSRTSFQLEDEVLDTSDSYFGGVHPQNIIVFILVLYANRWAGSIGHLR